MPELEIQLEMTPNPMALKYALNRRILLTNAEYYANEEEAEAFSPLARRLFHLGDVAAVMLGADFVSVTLSSTDLIRERNEQIIEVLRDHIEAGREICQPRDEEQLAADDDADSALVRTIINAEVRPAVAMDGGDIVFYRLVDDVVYVHMHGACAGCPSSTMTLKMGILSRLQQEIPTIRDVEPVA